jgi:hypothetical protein
MYNNVTCHTAEGWRKIHDEKLPYFYSSPNVRAIKSIRIRQAEQVALMGEKKCTQVFAEEV